MKHLIRNLGLTFFSSLLCSMAYAQDLYTILELALENDPTLKQAEAQYRANRENLSQSRSALLPNFGAGGSTSRVTSGPTDDVFRTFPDPLTGAPTSVLVQPRHSYGNGLNNHGWGVNLSQSVLNLASWYTFQSAKANDRAAAVNLAAQEQDLIMRVAMAYFDVLRAQELLATNLQEEEAALRSLEQTRQREEVGLVAITDVFDSQAAYDLARNTTILQRDLLRARFEALEAITGQPHGEIDELRADFPILEVDGSLVEWEDQAEDNSLAIAAARYNLDASRKNLRARKADRLPTVDLLGQYGHNVTAPIISQGIQIGGGAFDRTSLALSINIPIYTGGAV
ncbi:MAG: TolC family protein, partial [Pseudomonadota bacterium]|nr:TolC family protein [Pseudomonadota bacterium]